MKSTGELLLNFLLNACWQIMLVAAVAALGDLLLRRTVARYRHLLWVAALVLSIFLPLAASLRSFASSAAPATTHPEIVAEPVVLSELPASSAPAVANVPSSAL